MSEDRDLEDPAPRQYRSAADLREHYWKLLCTLFYVAVLYSSVHKLVIPLFLSQTRVLNERYAQVDFWFIPIWILAAWLFKEKRLKKVGSLLAGFVVTYAAWDLRNILTGVHPGWLAWSHALSSLPVGLLALFLLARGDRERSLLSAWSGAVFCGLFIFSCFFLAPSFAPRAVLEPKQDLDRSTIESVAILSETSCGLNEFRVSLRDILKRQNTLQVRRCGFYPQSFVLGSGSALQVRSELESTLNVHVIFVDTQGKRRRHRNRILKARESFVWSDFEFQENEIGALVFSDSRRDLGVLVAINPAFSNQELDIVMRSDRSVEVYPNSEFVP
jgi:hypothetical protein